MSRLLFLKILTFGILPLIIVGGFVLYFLLPAPEVEMVEQEAVQEPQEEEKAFVQREVIGTSVEGRDIESVSFGSGQKELLFVGGVHGGYEWNSSLLAYEMIEYFQENSEQIPADLTIRIIPSLNPDGLALAIGKEGMFTLADVTEPTVRNPEGRFNAHGVDLNRNFDCKWAPESTWRGKSVSAGTQAFSEPEAAALRDYVATVRPEAVVFWHSKANNVYASECESGVLPETLTLMSAYAEAASYGKVEAFTAYPITGDAEGWLASIGIPAVTVEFESGTSIEWDRNIAGVDAVLKLYSALN